MAKRILITGGAGFIGSHLADNLIARGYTVRALDCLSPQVHRENSSRPDYLHPDVELIVGDVRDAAIVRRALRGVDAVYHFAAKAGVGQSMYQIADYTSVNGDGTAILLEALVERPVERLIVASCLSIYGEGLYRSSEGVLVPGEERSLEQLRTHEWELRTSRGQPLTPVPTPETKAPALGSVYALSKYDQERMCLVVGRAYRIPTVALRFFNVYGPRQALANPYTGVLAIFASQLLHDRPPVIFEDGLQQRDFVNVRDIAEGCRLALEVPEAAGRVFNLGSGERFTMREIATRVAVALDKPHIAPRITGQHRTGDIRHCFANISLARHVLGYEPRVSFADGLADLVEWLRDATPLTPPPDAGGELSARGLAA
ncbi:MAG: NAD-dependent epimerase/dehydratase family protein [Opitutae bacterium]|nr:NAD-dependent epimerase/dehydratase family protein [Opitutae bacterium]